MKHLKEGLGSNEGRLSSWLAPGRRSLSSRLGESGFRASG